MGTEIIVGLDIGTTKIACFIGVRGENERVKILGFGKTESSGVEHGVVKNVKDTADAIRRAVDEASEQANVDVDEVWVGIAGQHIKSRPSQGSTPIPPEHVQSSRRMWIASPTTNTIPCLSRARR